MPYSVYVKTQVLVERYDGIHFNYSLLCFFLICTIPNWMRCRQFLLLLPLRACVGMLAQNTKMIEKSLYMIDSNLNAMESNFNMMGNSLNIQKTI
jgi:hypothetical protein